MSNREKYSKRELVPVAAAVVLAVVGAASLYLTDFGPKSAAAQPGITMITTAVVERAGAIALPTAPGSAPRGPARITP